MPDDVFPPILKTDRLILRAYAFQDAVDIFEYAGDPETTLYTTFDTHKCIYDTVDFLSNMRIRYENKTAYDYAIVSKENGKVIGGGGVMNTSKFPHTAEIGYILNKKYWGNGYAVEAMSAVIDYLFETLHIHRIEARHFAENERSGRVMQKLGMTYEGMQVDAAYERERYHSVKYYALINGD
ncbi:MAG: GNAT family N-acetyltransferase [Clostridiales bacterium]|jgi:ribosomal-protein-alanine N-acetyltransferase|nr:GNAT family N-acetyltransferase [Clostridiales bacterium]